MGIAMPADATEFDTTPVNERGRYYDPETTDDERTFALLGHLSVLGHVVIAGLAIIAPIIMYNTKKESAFAADHLREAINFQISLILYNVLLVVFTIVTLGAGIILAIPLGLGLNVLALVGMIMASLAAQRGEYFRYPMTVRFLS